MARSGSWGAGLGLRQHRSTGAGEGRRPVRVPQRERGLRGAAPRACTELPRCRCTRYSVQATEEHRLWRDGALLSVRVTGTQHGARSSYTEIAPSAVNPAASCDARRRRGRAGRWRAARRSRAQARPSPRRDVLMRRNAGRFRVAGGGVAQTDGCRLSQASLCATGPARSRTIARARKRPRPPARRRVPRAHSGSDAHRRRGRSGMEFAAVGRVGHSRGSAGSP